MYSLYLCEEVSKKWRDETHFFRRTFFENRDPILYGNGNRLTEHGIFLIRIFRGGWWIEQGEG